MAATAEDVKSPTAKNHSPFDPDVWNQHDGSTLKFDVGSTSFLRSFLVGCDEPVTT